MSDELTTTLRELAQEHETPPSLPGAEIRRRAVRRRARRRGAALAGGAVAAVGVVVFALTADVGGRTEERAAPATSGGSGQESPACTGGTGTASSASPAATASPVGTADLARRLLTVAGRELPISSGTAEGPTPQGRMSVVAKYRTKRMPTDGMGIGKEMSGEYEVTLPWVIELRTPENGRNYIVAMTYNEDAPGRLDATHGWIGLRSVDAEWLYEQLRPGAVLTVEGTATGTTTGTTTPTGSTP
ncbi:L,D-transpeptidase [Streptomyces sp. NPDC056909]|uniref:L,D-transpeptidase n=1 Tax=Streptomyces sp. NPDC056909 TaxID=3345963 RepID=UPI00367A9C95